MKHLIVAIAALAGTQAQALRCLHPDPVRSFQAAMDAPETYVVLRGTVSEAEILIPPIIGKHESYPVPVWFSGHVLTRDGFTQSLETPMTVQVNCAGPWCGSMLPGSPVIAFAQVADGTYVIEAGPCATWVFQPSPLVEELLTSCIRGGIGGNASHETQAACLMLNPPFLRRRGAVGGHTRRQREGMDRQAAGFSEPC